MNDDARGGGRCRYRYRGFLRGGGRGVRFCRCDVSGMIELSWEISGTYSLRMSISRVSSLTTGSGAGGGGGGGRGEGERARSTPVCHMLALVT